MTQEEFSALQPGDRVRTTNTADLKPNEQLQLARVSSVDGEGASRVVELDVDDGRHFVLGLSTSLERIREIIKPLPLPG
jgi:hypothetical protein